jgi:trehalose 6-phosphate synthase
MPKEERIRRWRAMKESVEREDVVWWRKSFVAALEKAGR